MSPNSRTGAASTLEVRGTRRLSPLANPKRHGVEVESDVIYGPHGDWNTLDIYRPVHRPRPWPVVFYVHGGALLMSPNLGHALGDEAESRTRVL